LSSSSLVSENKLINLHKNIEQGVKLKQYNSKKQTVLY